MAKQIRKSKRPSPSTYDDSSSTTDSSTSSTTRSPTPKRRRKRKPSSSKRRRPARSPSSDSNPPSHSRSRNHVKSRPRTRRSPSPRAPRQPRRSPRPSRRPQSSPPLDFHNRTERIDITKMANALKMTDREVQLIKTENWRRKYNSLYSKTRHHSPEKRKLLSAIDVHTKTISSYQSKIAEQESTIAEQKSTIVEQKSTIAEREATISTLRKAIAAQNANKVHVLDSEDEARTSVKKKFSFENFEVKKLENTAYTSTPVKKKNTNENTENQQNTDKNNNTEKKSWVHQKEWVSAIDGETISFSYDNTKEKKSADKADEE